MRYMRAGRWGGMLLVFLGVLFFSMVGCGDRSSTKKGEKFDEQDRGKAWSVETQRHALMGNPHFGPTCTAKDRRALNMSMRLGRIAASSRAWEECIQKVMTQNVSGIGGPYQPCPEDPFKTLSTLRQTKAVLMAARSNNDTRIECSGGPNFASAHAPRIQYSGFFQEKMTWNAFQLWWFRSDVNAMAALLWHEALHNHMYAHHAGCRAPGQATYNARVHSMPYLAQWCMKKLLNDSDSQCSLTCSRGGKALLVSMQGGRRCECVFERDHNALVFIRAPESNQNKQIQRALGLPFVPESKPLGGGSYYKKEMLFRGVAKGTKGPNTNKKTDKLIYELAHPNTLMVVESLGHSQPHLRTTLTWSEGETVDQWKRDKDDKVVFIGTLPGDSRSTLVIRSKFHFGFFQIVPQGASGLRFIKSKPGILYGDTLYRWRGSQLLWWVWKDTDRILGVADFNKDQKNELLIQAKDGSIAILASDSTHQYWEIVDVVRGGHSAGSWVTGSKDTIVGIGDLDKDGGHDILIKSPWGVGVLEMRNNRLKSGTLKAYSSPIGTTGLSFKRSDTIGHIALYDGPSEKHSFLTQGQQGLILVSVHRDSTGAMTFSPQLLTRPNKLVPNEHCTLHNGPLCQGITYNSKDRILAVGAFDKPDEMLILVENDLGLVIFRARLNIFGQRTLYSHSLRTNRSDDGLWSVGDRTANNTRIVHAVGDFNADGKQELVFRRVNQRLVH